jgi:hypothetical protein
MTWLFLLVKANANNEVRAMISVRVISDKPFSPSGIAQAVLKVVQIFIHEVTQKHTKE